MRNVKRFFILGEYVMKKSELLAVLVFFMASAVCLADPNTITHTEFQAINSIGWSTYTDSSPVALEGIIINNPEEWLDPAPGSAQIGGQWQLVIQGEGDDHAGTACWMGQNYRNSGQGDYNYTDEEWLSELNRLNYDSSTSYAFRMGDRVRVTGHHMFFAGKMNINETHDTDEYYDFTIELLTPAAGLPQPEEITVSDLKNPDDSYIFDPNRLTGPEYYQARLVRLNDVTVIDPENWLPGKLITVEDENGLTFPVYLGIGRGITKYDCPEGPIDVIGIMNQEKVNAGWPPDCTIGYRILVSNYDGNGLVLGDTNNTRGNLPGDINRDYIVDMQDFAELAENWLSFRHGLYE